MKPDRKLTDYRPNDLIPANEMPTLFPGTTAQTWNALRHKGNGPAFIKVCRKVSYRRGDVEAWIEQNRKVCTDRPVISTPAGQLPRKRQGRPPPKSAAVQHP